MRVGAYLLQTNFRIPVAVGFSFDGVPGGKIGTAIPLVLFAISHLLSTSDFAQTISRQKFGGHFFMKDNK